MLTLAPLFVLTILIGVYPAIVLDFIQAPVGQTPVRPWRAVDGVAAMTQNEWLAIAPFLIVSGLALLVIVVDLIWPRRPTIVTGAAVVGLVAAMVVTVAAGPIAGLDSRLPLEGQAVFGGVYIQDQLSVFLDLLFMAIALLTILFAPDYLEPRGLPMAEFTATLLFAISGAMLLAGAQDLLILFIGLELLVLPGYMLAGFAKRDGLSTEGAIKYFLLGSFSSAILLFGLAFVFGYTGTTSIKAIADGLAGLRGWRGAAGRAGHGPRAAGDGRRVQDRGGAVPLLDARRLPGLADAGHRLPLGRSQGGRVRAPAAAVRGGARADPGRLGARHGHPRGHHHDRRQPRGPGPGQHQADAGLQLHRAHRLHHGRADGVRGGVRSRRSRRAGIQGVLFYAVAYTFMNLGAFACVAALQRRPGVTSQISHLRRAGPAGARCWASP